MKRDNILCIILVTALILSIPLLLRWPWTLSDFIVMGTLIFGTGLMIELIRSRVKNTKYRILIILAILVAFLLIWVELAVGLFGTPFAGS